MPAVTSRGLFPYPTAADVDDVPADLRRLAERMAEVVALASDVPLGDRPAASAANRNTIYRNPESGLFSYSTGTDWVPINPPPAPKVVRLPLPTWAAAPDVLVASGDTGFLPPIPVSVPAFQTVTLVGVRHQLRSGTSATVSLQRNGANIPGLTNIVVTTTPTSTMLTPGSPTTPTVPLADLDRLAPLVTAVSGLPKNLSLTAFLDFTF